MTWIRKIVDFLAGWIMTAVGGTLLLASFVLPRAGVPAGAYLAWGCVVICGIPLLYLAILRIVRNRGIAKISSALLISMAMIAAVWIGDLFAAGEVAFIMELGALLEEMTTRRAQKGLKSLIALAPDSARVLRGGEEVLVPVSEVVPGDLLRILPGETVPVDGVVTAGETSVDQSVMTGESLPVDKTPGDEVFSGTVNRFGSVDVAATRVGEDSSLQKLIRMVRDAEKDQAPVQRIADRWASWLVPAALLIAVAAALVTRDVVRGVTVMVVFCPCALVLATPTAVMAAIGQAAKNGVVVKSGAALEKLGKIRTVAFDKTGTLTGGRLTVSDVLPAEGVGEDELLALAASAERRSEHPLGKAIVEAAREKGLSLSETSGFRMSAGRGISAEADGTVFFLGNEEFLRENGVPTGADGGEAARLRAEGKAVVLAASAERMLGLLALSDVLRPGAAEAVRRLEKMGTRTVLLTGDNARAAGYFAAQAGIETVCAGLLPGDKVEK
ncbi:MAG: cation-translocating P-type ATPase, partial [Oscillospiraceae bacterium]|nr:cation-translocating P-type ATPase [Oscillospiraceae bacterium]